MTPIRIALPDMISNSYFPILAACELGLLRAEGLDASLVLMSPADKAYRALGDGDVDFVGAEAHSALAVFPRWRGMKLLCAQAQGMYWFLVLRAELGVRRGDIQSVRGRRIGAAPWVDLGLKRLLTESGLDPARDGIAIAPIPGGLELKVNTGVSAAKALESGAIDGFWANGMGAEVAVRRGAGTIVIWTSALATCCAPSPGSQAAPQYNLDAPSPRPGRRRLPAWCVPSSRLKRRCAATCLWPRKSAANCFRRMKPR